MKDLITEAIVYINKNNPSNHLPYHSIDHLFEVYNQTKNISLTDKTVRDNIQYKNELLIAALFHDYNHSGGKLTDSENVSNAIMGCNEFLDSIDNNLDKDIIADIIKATEFPSPIDKEDLTLEQKVIQDADMCYLFKDIAIVKLYCGLREEFDQDLTEFLNNQLNFLESVKFNTDKLQEIWFNYTKEDRINELKQLIEHNE